MKELDCVEIIVEKKQYTSEGVHKGMQGWICLDDCVDGYRLINFPQYGDKPDIATLSVHENDIRILPNGMDAHVNEQIRARYSK